MSILYSALFILASAVECQAQWIQVGADISGDGATLAVGAMANSQVGTYTGLVRVYQLAEGVWIQQGSDILGTKQYGWMGATVSLSTDGSTVATNVVAGNGGGDFAKIFRIDANDQWTQIGDDITGSSQPVDGTGHALSLSADGNSIAVGSWFANSGINGNEAGEARVYTYSDSGWEKYGDVIAGPYGSNMLGYSVCLSADTQTIIVGAWGNSDYGYQSGMAQVYTYSTLGIDEAAGIVVINIYPNPSHGVATIQLSTQPSNGEVLVLALSGKTVYSATIHQKLTKLNLSGLANGIYALQVRTEDGFFVEKLVLGK